MSNFPKFIDYLNSFSPDLKGKIFELYCKWFLENDPRYSAQIKKVWLWKEWPEKWGIEKGIDLIAETHNSQIWAIQAKAYDEDHYITKADIDTFLSESSRKIFSFRLFIATTNKLGPNARETINGQEKEVSLCLLDKLEETEIEWPSSIEALTNKIVHEIKYPRPHQQIAIDNISKGFNNFDRGQLHMACGTGKTLVGLWIAQQLKSQITLILVPSISLVSQLYSEWVQNRNIDFNFDPIFICSDPSVHKKEDEIDQALAQTEFGFPITTNAQELLNAVTLNSRPKVIFSTYHSSPVLVEACKLNSSLIFDLAIADEAHRCAGSLKSDFTFIVNKQAIRASKRLFMTATPKIFSDNVKRKTKEVDYEIASMDEEAIFGPVFHKLSFSEAIKNDLLTDYQVVISIMDHSTYREYADKGRFVSINDHETDARTLASQLLVAKGMKEYGLARIITFHNRKSNAKEFIKTFDHALALLPVNECPLVTLKETIFGEMLQSERKKILKKLKDSEIDSAGLIANIKCLSEGVDVPTLDGIAFIDPKGSEIDIVQAVGRAIRKTADKKKGIIIIPVFLDKDADEEIDLNQSCFRDIWKVIKALKAHDDILAEELDNIRLELGKRSYRNLPKLSKIILDISVKISIDFGETLKLKIIEDLINNCSSSWQYYYKLLKEFRELKPSRWPNKRKTDEKNLNYWCIRQRKLYQNNLLSIEKTNLLNDIGFIWDVYDEEWNKQFEYLKSFRQLYPSRWPFLHEKFPSNNNLGHWCSTQRQDFKRNILKIDRLTLLNNISFPWVPQMEDWIKQFNILKEFRIKNPNRWPEKREEFPLGNKLGGWCRYQRQRAEKNILEQEKITQLNTIGFPWNPLKDEWEKQFIILKEFRKLYPNRWPTPTEEFPEGNKLGIWCSQKRQSYRKKWLERWKIEALNKINFLWDKYDNNWIKQFEILKEYRKINPTKWPEQRENFPSDNKLGIWCHRQRSLYKKQKLEKFKIDLLNSITFIWDPLEHAWNERYEILLKFRKINPNRWPSLREEFYDGDKLGSWCSNQRQDYKRGDIKAEKIHRLNAIKFPWSLK